MFIAEINLSHSKLVLAPTIRRLSTIDIELERQIIADADTYYLFFNVSGVDFEAFDAAVERDDTVEDSTVIVDGGDWRVYRVRLLEIDRLVLPKAAEIGIRVLYASGGDRGWNATLQVPDTELLQAFREHCTDRGIEFSVNRLYRTDSPGDDGAFGLTDTQRETLLTAYHAGYFEEPRAASLHDVAELLDISSSAASGRLRRSIETLLEHTIVVD